MSINEKKKILDLCLGKAQALTGLVDYADDSVVSKTLLDKSTGTLTLFAFAAGQGLSEHTSPYDATVHVLDGEAQIVIDGESIAVTTGELIVMPADVPHSLTAQERFKMLLIMIRN
jgi:quercetin dioxygenase-like cupin family protein